MHRAVCYVKTFAVSFSAVKFRGFSIAVQFAFSMGKTFPFYAFFQIVAAIYHKYSINLILR